MHSRGLDTPARLEARAPDEPPKTALGARAPWLAALGGPTVVGASLAFLGSGSAEDVLRVPAVMLGAAALMLPALYIGAALGGFAPSPSRLLQAALEALGAAGLLLLGLAPALAFLLATSTSALVRAQLAPATALLGALFGLGVLSRALFTGGVKARLLFTLWAMVTLTIGARLFAA